MWNSLRYSWFWDIGRAGIDPNCARNPPIFVTFRSDGCSSLKSWPNFNSEWVIRVIFRAQICYISGLYFSNFFPDTCAVGRAIGDEIVRILWRFVPHDNLQSNPVRYPAMLSACRWFSMHKSVTRNFKSPQEFRSGAFQNGPIVWARQRLFLSDEVNHFGHNNSVYIMPNS